MKVETGQCSGAGDGIGRVAVTVSQGRGEVIAEEGVEEFVRGDGDSEGKNATRDPLGEADQVWDESGLLVG